MNSYGVYFSIQKSNVEKPNYNIHKKDYLVIIRFDRDGCEKKGWYTGVDSVMGVAVTKAIGNMATETKVYDLM
jgi:hypothetical protein